MAVNLPKEGEMNLINTPAMKYQTITMEGPNHPTNSDNFLLNNKISKVGLVKLEYIYDKEWAHFSISDVNL